MRYATTKWLAALTGAVMMALASGAIDFRRRGERYRA